jgi:hypothetical protein
MGHDYYLLFFSSNGNIGSPLGYIGTVGIQTLWRQLVRRHRRQMRDNVFNGPCNNT